MTTKELATEIKRLAGIYFDCGRGFLANPKPAAWIEFTNAVDALAALAVAPTSLTDAEDAARWISVEERLPEPGVEVIAAGQGWGAPFSMACWYDGERREWWPAGTHWTDANGAGPQYPTHWMPLPPPPAIDAVRAVEQPR